MAQEDKAHTRPPRLRSPPQRRRAAGAGREEGRLNPNTATACPKSLQKQRCSTESSTSCPNPRELPGTHTSVPVCHSQLSASSPASVTGVSHRLSTCSMVRCSDRSRSPASPNCGAQAQLGHTWHPHLGKNLSANRAGGKGLLQATLPWPMTAEKANSSIPVSQAGNREIK